VRSIPSLNDIGSRENVAPQLFHTIHHSLSYTTPPIVSSRHTRKIRPQEAGYDQESKRRLQGSIGEGKKPWRTLQDQSSGGKASPSSRILQAQQRLTISAQIETTGDSEMRNKPKSKSKHHHNRERTRKLPSIESPQIVEFERIAAVKIDALPPNANLRKHPDEVYGDTEIPGRGQLLDDLKYVSDEEVEDSEN
jgi:hypothetical protein